MHPGRRIIVEIAHHHHRQFLLRHPLGDDAGLLIPGLHTDMVQVGDPGHQPGPGLYAGNFRIAHHARKGAVPILA